MSGSLKIERSRRVSRQKFNRYNRLGVVKFARCNAQTLPAFFDWSTPIFFHFLGIFFVKFESTHPQLYEIPHRGRQHPISLRGHLSEVGGWSVKYPIGLETRTLRRVTGTSVSWSRASRRNGIVGPAYAGLPSTTPVDVEKVRSQFLSLRNFDQHPDLPARLESSVLELRLSFGIASCGIPRSEAAFSLSVILSHFSIFQKTEVVILQKNEAPASQLESSPSERKCLLDEPA